MSVSLKFIKAVQYEYFCDYIKAIPLKKRKLKHTRQAQKYANKMIKKLYSGENNAI